MNTAMKCILQGEFQAKTSLQDLTLLSTSC